MIKDKHVLVLFLVPTIVILAGISIYPTVYLIRTAFTSQSMAAFGVVPEFIGGTNFLELFQDPYTFNALKVSTLFTALSVGISFALGLAVAYLLSQDFMQKYSFIRVFFIVPMVMAPVVVGLTWRIMLWPDFGIINAIFEMMGLPSAGWLGQANTAFPTVVFIDIWEWTPFVILVLLAGFQAIPNEPLEAAHVDGASAWQVFYHVSLPLLRPIIMVVLLLRVILAFQWTDTIIVMTNGGPGITTQTVSFYTYQLAFVSFDVGLAAAMALVILIITIMLSMALVNSMRRSE
jgi:multiple sugar transport system permease protein